MNKITINGQNTDSSRPVYNQANTNQILHMQNFCGVKFCVIKIILLFHNIQGVKFSRIVVWYCVHAIVYIKGRTHGASIRCLSCQGHYILGCY